MPSKLKLEDKVDSKLEKIDLSTDRNASATRLMQLKNDRHVDDIPLSDEYWKALRKHQTAFAK